MGGFTVTVGGFNITTGGENGLDAIGAGTRQAANSLADVRAPMGAFGLLCGFLEDEVNLTVTALHENLSAKAGAIDEAADTVRHSERTLLNTDEQLAQHYSAVEPK